MAKQIRGFAVMHPDMRRRIAGKGGRNAHAMGRAHEWTAQEAQPAGRKGGLAKGRRQAARPLETTPSGQTQDGHSVSPIWRSTPDPIVGMALRGASVRAADKTPIR